MGRKAWGIGKSPAIANFFRIGQLTRRSLRFFSDLRTAQVHCRDFRRCETFPHARNRGHRAIRTGINAQVTIRTKEANVPDEFQPARLFLDDIEEIVRILVSAIQGPNAQIITVRFTIKDRVCDETQELPKIAKKTSDLWIMAESANFGPAVSLLFSEHGSHLSSYALIELEQLRLFQKLAPIFKRRNLRLRTFVWSHYRGSLAALFGACLAILGSVATVILKPGMIRHPVRGAVAALPLVSTIIALVAILSYHSIIIMRPSSEPSPLRQELLNKFPLVAISSVLTFFLTLLGLYLKHKYWP